MRTWTLSLGIASLVVGVVGAIGACGSDSDDRPPVNDAGSDAFAADADVDGAAGDARADAADASVVTTEPFTPSGLVRQGASNVFVAPASPPDAGALETRLATYFLDYGDGGGVVPDGFSRVGQRATGCVRRTAGACTLSECALTADPSLTFASPTYVSAGTITATRSSGPELVATPSAGPPFTYPQTTAVTPGVVAGETVTITATGADVPAFTGTLPIAPAPVPTAPPPGTTVTWTKGTDVTVGWSAPGISKIVLSGTATPAGRILRLSCSFDGVAGSGTIPAALLANVAGSATFPLVMGGALVETSPGGTWNVTFGAWQGPSNSADAFELVVGN